MSGVEEWNLSLAGCGFRSVYYVGALSCILERAPQLIHGASKICGASSGCLVAAALTVGIPVEQLCVDILTAAARARRHCLRVFHPTFSLLRTVRDSLLEKLPADAHLRASGRLCVSLTRISDMHNVLVSEFDSREELIQVLMCSCFFPVYTGFIPPSYRGVRYMDGALSNNAPLHELRNTIIMAPFSGESDVCPEEGAYNPVELHYGNVSIQVNTGNVHRVCTSFLPPRLEVLAEICHHGYMDALCFLRKRDLLGPLDLPHAEVKGCCDLMKKRGQTQEKTTRMPLMGKDFHEEDHRWLDPRVIQNLPESMQKVLCEACRNSHDGVTWWSQLANPVKLVTHLLSLLILPIQMMLLFSKRVFIPDPKRPPQRPRDPSSASQKQDFSDGDPGCIKTRDQNIQRLTSAVRRNFDRHSLQKKLHRRVSSLNSDSPPRVQT